MPENRFHNQYRGVGSHGGGSGDDVQWHHKSPQTYQLKNVRPLGSPKKIISGPIDSHVLVNSGPGTGKTYSVIERLKYIVKNGLTDPGNVLVLCFSRGAVKVIRDRLSKAIEAGEIGPAALEFQICTFDSFATWYMREVDADKALGWMDYDMRIAEFIRMYEADPGILNEELGYLIVDELQDVVGIRGKLVETLLARSRCGFLLLGDLCQAIYDYQMEARGGPKASDLYRWIENTLPGLRDIELEEYELTENRRCPADMSKILQPLREAMLHGDLTAQNTALSGVIRKLGGRKPTSASYPTVAYLYRSNVEAFRKSTELYREKWEHNLIAGTRRIVLRREIVDALRGWDRPRITKGQFLDVGTRRNLGVAVLEEIWGGFLYALGESDRCDQIDMKDLSRALTREKRVSDCLIAQNDARTVVSTIHKAKGSEHSIVLLNPPVGYLDDPDEIKVYYVALTRAKDEVRLKFDDKKGLGRDRSKRINTERHFTAKGKGENGTVITGYELGMDGDIDPVGFVDKTCGDAEERQRYISMNVRRGDRIYVIRGDDGTYYIEHGDVTHDPHIIGVMNADAFEDIERFSEDCRDRGKSCPKEYRKFTGLYVRDVVTVAYRGLDPRIDDRYAGKWIWYGIDFCGLAEPFN